MPDALRTGLMLAKSNYIDISKLSHLDVKPKEDQIKCAIYRALSECGDLVHVEASLSRNGERCDLFAVSGEIRSAIEIKTAWAGKGWVNKPVEQSATWDYDIKKLTSLHESELADSCYFVLCLAYELGSKWEEVFKAEALKRECELVDDFEISNWNGLNRIAFYIKQVN